MSDELKRRIYSIDLLRGLVMMLMLLDHVREFVHAGALLNDPTNLATTTTAVFFTRWVTHFCAPAFVFLSGVSIYLQREQGKTNGELSRFLLTRGLWLVFLEFTVIRLGITFNFDYSFLALVQVIWVIGVSMIVMAGLIYVPVRFVGAIGLAMIVFHNLLDPFSVPPNVAFAGQPPPDVFETIRIFLHQPGIVRFLGGATQGFVAYPIIPWVGVMAVGYAAGVAYTWESDRRRKFLLLTGIAATALFVVVRAINVYGDPVPWSPQPRSGFTVISFLNTTKYPPSLLFLLMTLGPSLILLAITDRIDGRALWQRVAIVFGQVPLFFYILQWFYAHGAGVVLGYLAGVDVSYLFLNIMDSGPAAPPGHGFYLPFTYVVWVAGLVILFPLCLWYGNYKRRRKHWLLSYL